MERGFDSYFGYYAGSTDYYTMQSECWPGVHHDGCFESTNHGEPVSGCDLHRGRSPICNSTTYSTALFTEEAIDLISKHPRGGPPMFLYLAHQAVHVGNKPLRSHPEYALDQAPARYAHDYLWVDDVQRRNLSAMVTALDESVGNLSSALRAAGMWETTLMIFSTDNGGPVPFKASNYPLRNGKATCWEGGAKGIGFVTGGAKIFGHLWAAGRLPAWPPPSGDEVFATPVRARVETHAMIHVTDWLPTLCELAGCEGGGRPTGTKPLDGTSAWAAIAHGGATLRDEILIDLSGEVKASPAIIVGEWKLINTPSELYHLARDPGETTDLAASYPDKVTELKARLAFYNRTAVPSCDRLVPELASNPMLHGGVWTPWRDHVKGTGCPR